MRDGDQAGLALFRDRSAWVGIKRAGGTARVVMVNKLNLGYELEHHQHRQRGRERERLGQPDRACLSVDIRPGANRQGRFSYGTDGSQFTSIGTPFTMTQDWQFFMGYRFAIFNFATQALEGSVTVGSFSLTAP